VLPNTTADEGFELAERLRRLIADTGTSRSPAVTCSFGVAELDDHDADVWAGLQRADRQLYAAKHAGRNRTAAATRNNLPSSPGAALATGSGPRLVAAVRSRG
jgi:diguanylate cyclase (GGDEF)-like protein